MLFASRRISKVSTKSRVSNRRHRRRTFAASSCLDLSAEREVSALLRPHVSVLSSVSVLSAVEEEQAPPLSSSFSFSFSLLLLGGSHPRSPRSRTRILLLLLLRYIAPVKLWLRRDPRLLLLVHLLPFVFDDAFILFRKREREREFTEEELLLLRQMRGEEEERITDMTTDREIF